MTRDGAIAFAESELKAAYERAEKIGYKRKTKYIEVLEMAIKALKREPCEDAISKRAVNILVDELARAISDERCCMSRGRSTATIMQDILDLSSVKPQERTGHWITKPHIYGVAFCSECGFELRIDDTKFCPNCGARMEEKK